MISSKWAKQNGHIQVKGLLFILIALNFLGLFFRPLSIDINWINVLLGFVVLIGGLSIIITLQNRWAKSMFRVIPINQNQADFALRKLFKRQQISFYRTQEEGVYIYDLTSLQLTLSLKEVMGNNDLRFFGHLSWQPTSTITIDRLHTKNQSVSNQLAQDIDELVNDWQAEQAANFASDSKSLSTYTTLFNQI